jgi:nicotinate-nucleotide--dimethylbenzimidazole phosphoribosyltransferase
MGALADRASVITSAPAHSGDADDSLGATLGAYRTWLRERDVTTYNFVEVEAAGIDAAIDSGARLLVLRTELGDSVAERALIALLTGAEANAVVPQPSGMTDAAWMAQVILVRDHVVDLRAHQGDIEALLDTVPGATDVARALLTASARRTPVLLEGLSVWASAVAVDRLSFRAKTWWHGAGTSSDPAIQAAVTRIGIDPGLDLGLPSQSVIGARVHAAMIEID